MAKKRDNKGHFIKEESEDKIEMTQMQIDAGQTAEEAIENPVEGAQIHNK
jgi:hypothetical protein